MLGYVNRYISVAGVIRTFKKDYDSGYKHVNLTQQVKILYTRLRLLQFMLTGGAIALIFACLSMLIIFWGSRPPAKPPLHWL